MANEEKLEALKKRVEDLWLAIQKASELEKPRLRAQYQTAYDSYHRLKIWVGELSGDALKTSFI